KRRFVYKVGEVGAGKAGSAASDDGKVDIVSDGHLASVYAENFFAALDVRASYNDAAIEAAWTQERGIENVGTGGSGDEDDAFVGLEAIHFDEQSVQSLLALVVTAAETSATMASDRVNFIDKDDARSILFALLEEIADAAGADADKHFDEVGAGDREE